MRMPQSYSDRDIARGRLMGRRSSSAFRALASEQNWLTAANPLPDDTAIAALLAGPERARSSFQPGAIARANCCLVRSGCYPRCVNFPSVLPLGLNVLGKNTTSLGRCSR